MPRAFVTLSDSETDMHLDKLGLALPTYLGQVACRTFIPDTQNPSITKQMNIRGDFFRDSVPYLQPGFGGFFTSATGETDSGADRSVQYAIEFPLGTITQAKVGASDTLVVPSGADKVFFDKMYPPVPYAKWPRSAQFWHRTFQECSAGIVFSSSYKSYGLLLDRVHTSNAAVNGTMDPAYAGGSLGGNPFGPYCLVGPTTRPSLAAVGDSKFNGGTMTSNSTPYCGEIQGAFAPQFGFMDLSRGTQQAEQIAGSGFNKRKAYLAHASHGVLGAGVNDMITNGRTAVQVAGYRQTIIGFAPTLQWLETTLAPQTTSTDSWATVANQTVTSINAERVLFNQRVRAGNQGFVGFIDIADILESARNSGLWKAPGATGDGLHALNAGYALCDSNIDVGKIKPVMA
tara:strand:+ start:169 stop:1374 length:1206 start_codon:yes stop_codon:yes gene_type:complete